MALLSKKTFPIENLSGTPAGADGNKPWNLKTNISVDSTSVDNVNKITYVTVKYWVSGDPTGNTGYNGNYDASAKLTVNGKDYWYSEFSWDFRTNAEHTLKTVTNIPIYHNSSGVGAITISATLHLNYPYGIRDPQVIDAYTVYTGAIATADTFTVGSVYDGIGSTKATINRGVSTNKHKFQVDFPNGKTYTYDMGTSDTITLDSTFWSYARSSYPSSAKEVVGCWLWTYTSADVEVGYTYSTLTINFNTAANNPTVGSIRRGYEFKEMNSNVTGSNVLQGMSIINITSPSTTAVSGATISDVTMVIRKGISFWNSTSGRTWNNIRFTESGDYTLTITATDNRGNSGSSSYSFTVAPYKPPDIYDLKRTRWNPVTGKADDNGNAIKVDFTATGTGTLYLAVKNTTTGVTIANRGDIAGWKVSGNKYSITIGTFKPTDTDNILFTLSDDYSGTDTQTISAAFANIAMSLGKNYGIGAGGLYNMNDIVKGKALQVFDTAHFLSNVTFDVPPSGAGGLRTSYFAADGGILQFDTGEVIQWKKANKNVIWGDNIVDLGNWLLTMSSFSIMIPFAFGQSGMIAPQYVIHGGTPTTTKAGSINFKCESENNINVNVGVLVIGKA